MSTAWPRSTAEILKDDLFHDWYQVYPNRFQNKTNGVTPRRWMGLCNPELTQMLKYRIGGDFLKDLDKLSELKPMIDDDMVRQFNAIKRQKKEQLCKVIAEKEGVQLDPDFIFDVQVKRLHEYKRQLMNALSIVDIYFRLKNGELPDFQPTVYIFGAKSAPGYARAKAIIRYINRIAKMINNDPAVCGQAEGGLCSELQLLLCRAYHPRCRYLRADLSCRHRGFRHRQHEADAQRCRHPGHPGRRQCGDCPGGRYGQRVYLRPYRRGDQQCQGQLLCPGHLRHRLPSAPRHRHTG